MSYRDWVRYITAGIIFLILILFIADNVIGVWSQYQVNKDRYRDYQQRTDKDGDKAAYEIANDCAVVPLVNPALRNCLKEKIAAYQKKNDTNEDLKAQQDMAFWALWTAIVGFGGLIVSMGGVTLLILSLRQTRQAITNDREIGEAQVRAYLSVDFDNRDGIIPAGEPPDPEMTIKNTGQSPAHKVRYIAKRFIVPSPVPYREADFFEADPRDPHRGSTIAASGALKILADLDDPLAQEQFKSINEEDGPLKLCVACVITYEDTFRRGRKTRLFAYWGPTGKRAGPRSLKTGKHVGPELYTWFLTNSHNDAT